ncbi:hypothetical protein [Thermococcus radiotolerans]|uniref:hypothetical protein n=1 Tax=Thermococcus radiotolerans TaxID=187880 RepID=UPI0012FD3EA1|nr:hypothetical protein [Thermococcus radiotolerans]
MVVLAVVLILPKGVLIKIDPADINPNDLGTSDFFPCPPDLQVKAEYYQYQLDHFVNFTLAHEESGRANITLEGVSGKHICIPEGIFVYSYYLGDPAVGINAALFDYNLSLKWWRHFQIVDNRIYVTLGYYSVGTFSGETKAFLYLISGDDVKRKEVANIEGHPLGVRLPLDINEKYVAVAYYLHDEIGNERNGVCVFTSGGLIKIACKEFEEWERPVNVKLEGDIVYVQTTKGVKAYKIISLW